MMNPHLFIIQEKVMRGTSNAPLILGIIGGVLMLPTLLCGMACGAMADAGQSMSTGSSNSTYTLIMFIFFAPPIITGIVGGVKGKSNPNLSCILLVISAVAALIGWVVSSFLNMFALAPLILFIIGAIIAKTQKMEGQ